MDLKRTKSKLKNLFLKFTIKKKVLSNSIKTNQSNTLILHKVEFSQCLEGLLQHLSTTLELHSQFSSEKVKTIYVFDNFENKSETEKNNDDKFFLSVITEEFLTVTSSVCYFNSGKEN